jgi:hypothetical protein
VNTNATWRRFAQLNGPDRATVLRGAAVLTATWMALRVVGFRRWKNLLDHMLPAANPAASRDPALLAPAANMTRLYSAAARHLFLRTNCLEQAVALYFLLRRVGLPAELRFGARKQSAQLEAHAWVVCCGVALNEDQGEHRHFFPFDGVNPLMETLPD